MNDSEIVLGVDHSLQINKAANAVREDISNLDQMQI
jgi:hypothetical protein